MDNYINGVCGGPRPARGAARRSASAQWPAGEDVEKNEITRRAVVDVVWLCSAAGTRRRGLTFKKSGMALPATFSPTRAHRRDWGGRAAAAHV